MLSKVPSAGGTSVFEHFNSSTFYLTWTVLFIIVPLEMHPKSLRHCSGCLNCSMGRHEPIYKTCPINSDSF
jgi:hypothetical protein